MASKASIAGHPIHPMLVPIPIGLFVFSLVGDLASRAGFGGDVWPMVALYCMAGGIVGALLAAPFGLVDLLSMSDERVKKIGIAHMVINLGVVALFACNFLLRWPSGASDGTPFLLSVIAILLLLASGWLGGHMVFVHGAAVAAPGDRPVAERRKMRVPVRNERRTMGPGSPIGQH
jgi:uncharacterized membrane protein